MDCEELGVQAVRNSLARTNHSKGYINVGDKMPSWDGDIILYKSSNYSKDNIRKLSVQVKGLHNPDFSKSIISYSVEKKDLINYFNDGGVLYFVVYIDDSGLLSKIYYKELLPVFIKQELAKSDPTDESISIKFKSFPEVEAEKMNICYDFVLNREKQLSYINLKFPTIDELKDKEDIEFNFSLTDFDGSISNHPEKLLNKEIYLYAMDKNKKFNMPMSSTICIKSTATELHTPINVDNKKFYDKHLIIRNENTMQVKIGTVITIHNDIDSDTVKFNINIKGTLKERIIGLRFLIEAHEKKHFNVGKLPFDFILKGDDEKSYLDLHLEEKLCWLEEFQKVLDTLGVKKDLKMDDITDKDFAKMDALIQCINHNKFLPNRPKNIPFQGVMKIGNLSLTLICVMNAKNESEYKFYNAFDNNLWAYNFDNNNPERKFPICCTLKRDNFLYDDNINYDFIVERIKAYESCDLLSDMTNILLLQMLQAYDQSNNNDLYSALKQLAQYLCDSKEFNKHISKINFLQIKQRREKLSAQELKELNQIYNETEINTTKIACLILLKSYELAETLLNELPENEQQEITNYPIYNLLKKKENNNG